MQLSKRTITFSLLILILSSSAGIFDLCLCNCHNHEVESIAEENDQCCSNHILKDSNCKKFNYQKADINYYSAANDTEHIITPDLSFTRSLSLFDDPGYSNQMLYHFTSFNFRSDNFLSHQRKDLFSLRQCLLC